MALGVIKKNPGLTQSELASELELGAAAVGRLIDRLEERDFIVRSPALDDRRAYTLDLTPAANALVLSLDATAQELKDDLLHSLSEQEISSLNRGLNKLKSNLQRLSATAISVFPLRPDTCAELQTTLCSVPLL